MEPPGTTCDYQTTTFFHCQRWLVIKETAISWSNHRCSMMGAASVVEVFSLLRTVLTMEGMPK